MNNSSEIKIQFRWKYEGWNSKHKSFIIPAKVHIEMICTYLLSPTINTGELVLNAIWFNWPKGLRGTICWLQIAEYLSMYISKMCVLPSIVTQAKTVLEYGAHAISPTWDSRSKMKRGTLGIENKKIIVISIELLLWRKTISCNIIWRYNSFSIP